MHSTRDSFAYETPDIYLRRLPTQLLTAQAYFVAKNRAACKGPVKLAPGDTWEALADRLGERFGYHIWHPWHWESVAQKLTGALIFRALDKGDTDAR